MISITVDLTLLKEVVKTPIEKTILVAPPPPPPMPSLADLVVDINSMVPKFYTGPLRVEGDDTYFEETDEDLQSYQKRS